MLGFWNAEKDIDMYLRITNEMVKLTIPSYDIYDKECISYEVSGNMCEFNYDIYKYLLVRNGCYQLVFLEQNRKTGEEKEIIFKRVTDEKYINAMNRVDRREQLKEDYLRIESKSIEYKYHFENINLKLLKQKVKFDEWIDKRDEISMIKSILRWIDDNIKHNGKIILPMDKRAINLLEFASENGYLLNCRGLAIVANELCLLAGLYSRFVVCMQKEKKIDDNHVVVNVFLPKLNKWVMIDPSYNAIVYSFRGTALSIEEIRKELAENNELILNDEANYYNKKLSKELYFRPLIKKLYRFATPIEVYPGCDKEENLINLVPNSMEYLNSNFNLIDNPDEFWK